MESMKMLQEYFEEYILSQAHVFEWHKGISESREVIETLPRASCPPTFVNDDNIQKLKDTNGS